jgi:ribosomal protein S18 acetylase RimI-like enzyme
MTADEHAEWRTRSVAAFAEDLARANGGDIEAMRVQAEQTFPASAAEGVAADPTGRTWFLRVLDPSGAPVGWLWLGPHPRVADAAYVYDIEIAAEHRGRGLGRGAMLAAERVLRDAGMTQLGLNVFGHNAPASRLYGSLGYQVVSTQMMKSLREEP